MSKLWDNLLLKLVGVIAVILFIVGFIDLLSVEHFYESLGELLSVLPFSEEITTVICKVMQYNAQIPIVSNASIFADFLKLGMMAFLQPIVVSVLSKLFLKVPKGTIYEIEDYMDSFGYRIKKLIISVLTAPFVAILALNLSERVTDFITVNYGGWAAIALSIITVAVLFLLSLLPMLYFKISIGTAISYRLLVTFLTGMVKELVTNTLCLVLYVAILKGTGTGIISTIFAFVVFFIIMDFAIRCFTKAVVG